MNSVEKGRIIRTRPEEYPDFYKLANQTFGAVEEEITEHRVRNFAMYVLDCAPSDITFLTNDDLYGPKRKLAEVGICQDYINQAQPFLGEWAQEAIDEGMSIAQVADLVGTTWPRIKRYITKLQESDKA